MVTMAFNLGNLFKKKGNKKVTVTSINIRWRGSMHALGGFEVGDNPFTITIPFQNKTQQDALPFEALKEKLKAQEKAPIRISGIDISTPFKLISVEPKPPVDVPSSVRVEFKMTVQAPDYTYSGPIAIALSSEEADMIKVQINKVVVTTPMKSVEIENSGIILNMPKGGIFKNSIQLYKAMSYGERVDKVTLEKPFEFVSCDHQIPFTINEPSSYLVTFYIKAPDVDYAGPMEIKLE